MKPYGSKRSYDTEPRMKSGRALVRREGADEIASELAEPRPAADHRPMTIQLRGANLVGGETFYGDWQAAGKPTSGSSYRFVSAADVDYELAKGATSFRLVFGWEAMQRAPKGPLDPGYLAELQAVVARATAKGARVLLDVHGGKADVEGAAYYGVKVPGSYQGVLVSDALADLWGRIASTFASSPLVSFGLMNEPNGVSPADWFAAARKCVAAIRATGAKNRIACPGSAWDAPSTWVTSGNAAAWNLVDPAGALDVQVHVYADANNGGNADDVVSETVFADRLKPVVDWARARGLKVVIGEIGIAPANPLAAKAWANFVAYCEANADVILGWHWWAHGPEAWWSGWRFTLCPSANMTVDSPSMKLIAAALAGPVVPVDPTIALKAQIADLTAKLAAATTALDAATADASGLRAQLAALQAMADKYQAEADRYLAGLEAAQAAIAASLP